MGMGGNFENPDLSHTRHFLKLHIFGRLSMNMAGISTYSGLIFKTQRVSSDDKMMWVFQCYLSIPSVVRKEEKLVNFVDISAFTHFCFDGMH